VKYYVRNVALQKGLGARQWVDRQVIATVALASHTGKAICNALSVKKADAPPPQAVKAAALRQVKASIRTTEGEKTGGKRFMRGAFIKEFQCTEPISRLYGTFKSK
jgi:hypothetical protein